MIFALITRLFTGEAGIFIARLKRMAGLYVAMGILGLSLLVFLVCALFIWSSRHLGSLETALVFAGVSFVLMLITYGLARLAGRRPATRDDDRLQRDIASIAGVTALTNAPQIMRAFRQKRGLIVLPVAAAGFYGLYRLISAARGR